MRKILAMCLGLMLFSITTPTLAFAQSGKMQIKGVVVDAAGDPVLGAAVAEVGTTNGVTTDLNGQYVLNVSDPKSIISVSIYKDLKIHLLTKNRIM